MAESRLLRSGNGQRLRTTTSIIVGFILGAVSVGAPVEARVRGDAPPLESKTSREGLKVGMRVQIHGLKKKYDSYNGKIGHIVWIGIKPGHYSVKLEDSKETLHPKAKNLMILGVRDPLEETIVEVMEYFQKEAGEFIGSTWGFDGYIYRDTTFKQWADDYKDDNGLTGDFNILSEAIDWNEGGLCNSNGPYLKGTPFAAAVRELKFKKAISRVLSSKRNEAAMYQSKKKQLSQLLQRVILDSYRGRNKMPPRFFSKQNLKSAKRIAEQNLKSAWGDQKPWVKEIEGLLKTLTELHAAVGTRATSELPGGASLPPHVVRLMKKFVGAEPEDTHPSISIPLGNLKGLPFLERLEGVKFDDLASPDRGTLSGSPIALACALTEGMFANYIVWGSYEWDRFSGKRSWTELQDKVPKVLARCLFENHRHLLGRDIADLNFSPSVTLKINLAQGGSETRSIIYDVEYQGDYKNTKYQDYITVKRNEATPALFPTPAPF